MPTVAVLKLCKKKKCKTSKRYKISPYSRERGSTVLEALAHCVSLSSGKGNKATLFYFLQTLSLYFYLASVDREPRFWQQSGLTKSFIWYALQLSGASILLFWILNSLWVHPWRWMPWLKVWQWAVIVAWWWQHPLFTDMPATSFHWHIYSSVYQGKKWCHIKQMASMFKL